MLACEDEGNMVKEAIEAYKWIANRSMGNRDPVFAIIATMSNLLLMMRTVHGKVQSD